MSGKVVVNRCMSLDGFIAGPGHSMDWGGGRALADFVAPDDFAEVAAATGAMLVGRRTWEVGDQMEAEEPGSTDYPFSGPMFLLTHRPLDPRTPKSRFSPATSGRRSPPHWTLLEARTWKSSAPTWPASACSVISSTTSWSMCCLCSSATASPNFRDRL